MQTTNKKEHDIYQIVRMIIKMIDPYYVLEIKCKFIISIID